MPSQRNSVGSSSGPSRRRREPSSESDDSVAGDEAAMPGSQGDGGGRGGLSGSQIKQCASQLVRLALFHEYQRKVIRRDLIFQKVIPPNSKSAFNIIFARAQTILRQNFGMELYELRARGKGAGAVGPDGVETQTQAQTQSQKQKKKQPRPSRLDVIEEEEEEEDEEEAEQEQEQAVAVVKQPGSKTYIVRSILSPEIREMMATPYPLNIPADERGDKDDDYVDSGALLPLDKADGTPSGSIQLLGIRTVILSLVMCMGRVIADDHLHSLLKRLHLYRDTILPYTSPDGKDVTMTLDKYLDLLYKQQYLEKVKVTSQVGNGEAAQFEWRWGSREAEYSEKAVQEWMTRLLAGEADDDDDEEDEHPRDRRAVERRRARRDERAQKASRIKGDIVKAAGGPLTGDL